MKRSRKALLRLALFLLVGATLLCACSREEPDLGESGAQSVPYDEDRLSEYLRPFPYRDLTVTVEGENEPRGEAVMRRILADAEVIAYPEEQVNYYADQLRAEYRYQAKRGDMSYEELLSLRGITEEAIGDQARQMVKSDLVCLYIRRDAGIGLTEAEKTAHYDRYADKYVSDYGYDRAYVDQNMKDEIYESMLYDKTVEYLILHNDFEVKHG